MVDRNLTSNKYQGFTIVELLIVIVVIGILAAITIVAYGGVQNRANDTAVKSDLRNFAQMMELYKAENTIYPTSFTVSMGIKFSKASYGLDYQSYNVRYCRNAATDDYIMYVSSKSGNYFKYTPGGGIESAAATYGFGVCSQIGLVNTNPTPNGLSSTTWSAWVN